MLEINVAPLFLHTIYDALDDVMLSKAFSPASFTSKIAKASKELLIQFKYELVDIEPDTISFNAYHAHWKRIPIKIVFLLPESQKKFRLKESQWSAIKQRIITAILHENRHADQYKWRNNKLQRPVSMKEALSITRYHADGMYMADPDEVDAYAFHAAMQIGYYKDSIHSNTICKRYRVLFEKSSSVRKKFFRKLYKHLNV